MDENIKTTPGADVDKGSVLSVVRDWVTDPARKVGDITYIENELDIELLTWQKEVLYYHYKHPYAVICLPKASGKTILKQAIKKVSG